MTQMLEPFAGRTPGEFTIMWKGRRVPTYDYAIDLPAARVKAVRHSRRYPGAWVGILPPESARVRPDGSYWDIEVYVNGKPRRA